MDAILDLIQQYSRRLATLTCIALVVLMSLSVADTALFIFENMSEEALDPAATQPLPTTRTRKASVNLASLNLFGEVREQARPQVVDAPETRLNLELQGVFAAGDPESSTAIVAEGNKPGELYHIGDRLPGNATLTDVFDNYILIKRGDRIEKLMFDDSALRGQASLSPRSSQTVGVGSANSSVRSRLEQVRARISQGTTDQAPNRNYRPASSAGSIRDYVERYGDRIRTDPAGVLDELGIETVEAGEAKGYRVGGEVDNRTLQRAGLQQGDVIVSVNGSPVGNVMNDRSLVNQALSAGRVRVEILRGSRRFFLTVPIPRDE